MNYSENDCKKIINDLSQLEQKINIVFKNTFDIEYIYTKNILNQIKQDEFLKVTNRTLRKSISSYPFFSEKIFLERLNNYYNNLKNISEKSFYKNKRVRKNIIYKYFQRSWLEQILHPIDSLLFIHYKYTFSILTLKENFKSKIKIVKIFIDLKYQKFPEKFIPILLPRIPLDNLTGRDFIIDVVNNKIFSVYKKFNRNNIKYEW
jgi:regulator of replication initiation timing